MPIHSENPDVRRASSEEAIFDGKATASGKRPYAPPRLHEYGRLTDLTQNNSNLTPGDPGGQSYSTF
jgi:hypothetical protein